jgi:hypothetical protein
MNKIYTTGFRADVAGAGAVSATQFQIVEGRKPFMLKSIVFDLRIFETVNLAQLPLNNNLTQDYVLNIQASLAGAILFAQPFVNALPAGNVYGGGLIIRLYRPQQIFYESFFVNANLWVVYNHINQDPAKSYTYDGFVSIETESLD